MTSRRSLVDRLLALPLVGKLIGANTLILVAAVLAFALTDEWHESTVLMLAAIAIGFAVNVLLVWVALRPLWKLEETAHRIHSGDFAARVDTSRLADRNLTRVGETLNQLVDRLTGDRSRMRELASQVIQAQDEERARVARELHDSTAQTLAAVMLQIRALSTDGLDPATAAKLHLVRDTVAEALEDVRTMAHTMYPRILDDLGLGPALEWLASRAQDASGMEIQVVRDDDGRQVPHTAAAVLYRVAQEAVHNALTHSGAAHVSVRYSTGGEHARIDVIDDGRGFDPDRIDRSRAGMGLFAIRERASLVDGRVEIDSAPGRGARISAIVPIR